MKYVQITATDISERWELTAKLQRQNDELKIKSEELSETIANIHILSREREAQKAKMRAHDLLGGELALLLRTIRSDKTIKNDLLRSMAQGFINELKIEQSAAIPQIELDSLRQAFESFGVKILIIGELPDESAIGRLFVDIIREGISNAVRHGFATEVSAEIALSDDAYCLTITDNGQSAPGTVTEGGGIGGIRSKVRPLGGTVTVVSEPRFILTIKIPAKKPDEKDGDGIV